MCAGDFAMISFCNIHRNHKVFTWDDADLKEAYFYEEIEGESEQGAEGNPPLKRGGGC
jgi:hypothetical protein